MIALYNVAEDVEGTESKVTTLTERSDYSKLSRIAIDEKKKKEPVELVQARYAVAIAGSAGAEQYAPEQYKAASQKLDAAQLAATAKKNSEQKMAPDLAREAVIAGEDARRAAMIGAAEAEAERERQAAAAAAAEAQRVRSAAESAAKSPHRAVFPPAGRATDDGDRARIGIRDRRSAVRDRHVQSFRLQHAKDSRGSPG